MLMLTHSANDDDILAAAPGPSVSMHVAVVYDALKLVRARDYELLRRSVHTSSKNNVSRMQGYDFACARDLDRPLLAI